MGLGGRHEDVDLIEGGTSRCSRPTETLAQLERRVEAALVRDQDAERDLFGHGDLLEHRGRIGQLGNHIGAHEARDLQASEARAGQRIDQLDLALGRDHLGLVLKAVAGTDLPDAHRARQRLCERAHHIERPPLTFSVCPVT